MKLNFVFIVCRESEISEFREASNPIQDVTILKLSASYFVPTRLRTNPTTLFFQKSDEKPFFTSQFGRKTPFQKALQTKNHPLRTENTKQNRNGVRSTSLYTLESSDEWSTITAYSSSITVYTRDSLCHYPLYMQTFQVRKNMLW